jgi:Asp-tRNA(Asn)/Glu-tRNA(Gln) amidotransferase A subunit family amidase
VPRRPDGLPPALRLGRAARAPADETIFTLPASLTGAPGVVVPVAEDAGLPIAVQIVARRWRDDVALRIAEALES